MSRDYEDLRNNDLAVYNFRGYTIIKLDKVNKSVDFGNDAYMCSLVPQDLVGLSRFLLNCHAFVLGLIDDVETVEVN